jgi:ferric-dicitrate binding protein FerR (iron transport regulator)
MTPHSPPIDLAVLGRYLDGGAAPEDRAAVEAWVAEDVVHRAAVAALREAWAADARRLAAPYAVDTAWVRLAAQVGLASGAASAPRRWGGAGVGRGAIAAAIVAALLGGGGAWWIGRARPAAPPAMRDYATPRGRRAVFRLLDGTEIMLNADSRLRAPVTFAAGQRDVYLDGEAFFRVVHDAARPFVVHTPGGSVRDIGTRFGIHAYSDAARERVAVLEGAVAMAETAVRAGQVATRSRTGTIHLVSRAKVQDELAWTRGRLVFESVPLGEVARQLGRWYDLDIQVGAAALADRPVTGSYGDEPVSQVLTLITAAVGARYQWHGRSVTIATAAAAR